MSQDESHGSFTTGFTIGLFAGAAGYFLFGTKRGAQLRQQMVSEWEDAKERLAEEGVIESPNISLREFVKDLMKKAFLEKQELLGDSGKKPVKVLPRRRETGKRFKGV